MDNVNLPGPGTAALFGAALIFAAIAWSARDFSEVQKWIVLVSGIILGVSLLITGIWIEKRSFEEKAREKRDEFARTR